MFTLGIDIGSSSVKVALLNVKTGNCAASIQLPDTEMPILAFRPGWAEQDPSEWWDLVRLSIPLVLKKAGIHKDDIKAIGITYQMHGLVCVDKNLDPLRNSIIWCDSRAVPYGNKAFESIGKEYCLSHLLNSPGNFTASKLAWVKENEPQLYQKIHKIMLPGDFIAMKLTGDASTTITGLSEGIFWDFKTKSPATFLLDHYNFDVSLLSQLVPHFGNQGFVTAEAAAATGLPSGIPVTYRAGDQPNNAFSLNVLNPGEIAATAGTSGVVYGVTEQVKYDPLSRVNTFVHVNHDLSQTRLGVLLCINGTGIMNSWMRKIASPDSTYEEANRAAGSVAAGSLGLTILPFGNGAERMLNNLETGCSISGLNFNIHSREHMLRAAQEGIAFSFFYGMKIMQEVGIHSEIIRAGKANMFLSPVFRQTLADISGAEIQLYDTDGALGAARGAAVGARIYSSFEEAFEKLRALDTISPQTADKELLTESFERWNILLKQFLSLDNQ